MLPEPFVDQSTLNNRLTQLPDSTIKPPASKIKLEPVRTSRTCVKPSTLDISPKSIQLTKPAEPSPATIPVEQARRSDRLARKSKVDYKPMCKF